MVKNISENRRHVIEMIKELSDYFNTIRDELCEPYGVSSMQAIILLDIYHHPEGRKITDICKRLHKSTNSISPLINRLVQKGYLGKEQSQQDKRITFVTLTNKTREIMDSISLDVSDYTWPFFEGMSDEQFDKVYEALSFLLEVTRE